MAGNLMLNSDHDIIIGRGAARVDGAEQVAQLCKCRLLTLLNEWKLDRSLGIDWFNSVVSKRSSVADIQTACAKIIRDTNGVLALLDINISFDKSSRKVTINFDALSVYGDISEVATWQK
jgi:hypothetical protein